MFNKYFLPFILYLLSCVLYGVVDSQDYQLMYEPLYPSGSNRMLVNNIQDTPIYNYFAPSINSDDAWMALANKKSDPQPVQPLDAQTAQLPVPQIINPPENQTTNTPENHTANTEDDTSLNKALSGLNGQPCVDMYPECPDFKEHNYCKKYKKQMMFQCRKTCNFCDISPYNYVEQRGNVEEDEEPEQVEEEASGDEEDEESGSGHYEDEESSGSSEKRFVIPIEPEPENLNINEVLIEDEKHFDKLKTRFKIPGLVPSLEDLYAEIGTIHPSIQKAPLQYQNREVPKRRSKIEGKRDPFKYLKNAIGGASIHPIVDRTSLSSTRVQRSNPVYVFKTPRSYVESKNFKRSIEPDPSSKRSQNEHMI